MRCHVVPLQLGATPPLVSIYYPKDAVESDQKEEHTENLEEQRDSSPKFPEVIIREPEPNLPEPSVEHQGGEDDDSPSFWHRAVRQLYEVYFQGRWHEIFQWLQPLPVSHWRQLLDFGADFRCFTFIRSYSYPPPAVPLQLLQHLAQVLLLRREPSRVPSQTKTTPLLYLYLALLLRSLCLPNEQSQKSQSAAPAKPVQFAVRLAGAPSMAALLQCYGAAEDKGWWQNFKSAWELRGHEVLAECQALLAELYPDHPKTTVEATERTKPPCLASLLTTAALQFSIQNLQSSPSQERNGNSSTSSRLAMDSRALYHVPEPDSGWCLNGSEGMLFAQVLQSCSVTTGSTSVASERFLRCFMDVLALSPMPISPTSEANGEVEIGEAPEALEIRNFSRLLRVLLQAYFIDPTLLAAEAPREALAAGAFAGPSDPDEFVPILRSGPLRRSLAFMEQSPLLQVVQRRLCSAPFDDVEGSTEQLSSFALRNLRVMWFDLRRSTCTLKRSSAGTFLLLMKPLKLQLSCESEAELATFPLTLSAGAQVTVRGMVISITGSLDPQSGLQLTNVAVTVPELEIKLSDVTLLSRIAASAILSIFQSTLQEHLQLELQRILMRILEREIARWNANTWSFLQKMVPEDLAEDAMRWLDEKIPPEGLPI